MLEYIINYESVKNNYYLRAITLRKDFDKIIQGKGIQYTCLSNESKNKIFDENIFNENVFTEIYKANKVGLTYTIRFISAIPFAFWDVTVCTIARLAAYILMLVLKQDNPHVQFYHIGKNFEMAGGRLYGMFWNDKEGLKIVHRAALDKRLYTVKIYTDTSFYDKGGIPLPDQVESDKALSYFYSEAVWNRRNIKRASKNLQDEKIYDNFFYVKLGEFNKSIEQYFEEDAECAAGARVHYKRLEKIQNELIFLLEQGEDKKFKKRKIDEIN